VQTITAEVNFIPTVNFAATPTGCTVVFTGVVSNNADSVRWDFGDGSGTSTALNPTYTYSATQSYLVTLTAFDGTCSNDTVKAVFVNCVQSLSGNAFSESISIYPNPSQGEIRIQLENETFDLIEVIDVNGQRLFLYEGTFSGYFDMDLKELESGKYMIRLSNKEAAVIKNLIISK
jgi:PKD repeat protein